MKNTWALPQSQALGWGWEGDWGLEVRAERDHALHLLICSCVNSCLSNDLHLALGEENERKRPTKEENP
jgi:hypothetical protein